MPHAALAPPLVSLTPGSRLGPYEVLAFLDAGGMGEVYRARDTTLGRDVALKVLPEIFALDRDRLTRFTREAHVLAALNHPHIAAIYGLEESQGVRALVLELVEGPTLADRLARGALPLYDALPIARQIAEALEAAHEIGIVHRDLKPANVKVRPDGTVKVLDFGLAKALDSHAAATRVPALTSLAGTQLGTIMGTAAYMSPEQARGKPIDKRADIWAFGCVLYEMLTGKRPFAGDEASDTIAKIIERDPDWTTLDPVAPASMSRLVRRCLQKDPRDRLRDIGDARIELAEAQAASGAEPGAVARPWRARGVLGAGVLAGLVFGALGVYLALPPAPPVAAADASSGGVRVSAEINLSADAPIALDAAAASIGYDPTLLDLSPDGRTLVYVGLSGGTSRLFARQLDSFDVRALPGTEGAIHPFFSPDGRSVGFLTNAQLKTHSLAAATTATICNVQNGVVATWTTDDQVLFVAEEGRRLQRVSARGGMPATVGEPREGYQYGRAMLDGSHALVTYRLDGLSNDYAQILLLDLADGTTRALPINGYDGRFVQPGHLVFGRSGRVFAVRFDAKRLEVSGEPISIATDVRMSAIYPHMQLAVSSAGVLVYVPGGEINVGSFVWHGRNGETETLPLEPRVYGAFALSNDGQRLAVQVADNKDYVLVYDLARKTSRRLASADSAGWPKWSPDGASLAFTTFGEGRPYRVLTQPLDSDRAPVLIAESIARPTPSTWTDKQLSFYEFPGNRIAFATFGAAGAAPAVEYLSFGGGSHDLSPDGRWLVYSDGASGLNIRSMTAGERVQRIAEVGVEPRWCHACDEIVYRNGNRWFSSRVRVGDDVEWEPPQFVLETDFIDSPGLSWALSADGQRILVLQSSAPSPQTKLHVISDWLRPNGTRPGG